MKKRILVRRSLLAGAMLVAGGGGIFAFGSTPAGASTQQVTAAGSFTTYQMMHNIFGPSLNDLLPGSTATTKNQRVTATATLCKTGVKFTAHGGAPNGSTKGKDYLASEAGTATPATMKGCVDFARSSSPPQPSDATLHTTTSAPAWPGLDYYAYALDGVAPMVGANAGGSRESAVELTLTQIKKIYECKPHYTTWKTLTGPTFANSTGTGTQGGVAGAVVRFWPQSGSGTRSVYTGILGFTPDKTTHHTGKVDSTCGTTATPSGTRPITTFKNVNGITGHNVVNEENSEQGIIYYNSLHPGAIKNAIFIFSSGKFEQEWNKPSFFNKTHENTVTGKTGATAIGNFNATTLLLAKVKSRTNSATTPPPYPTAPFVIYASPASYHSTTTRGTYSINTSVVKEANEWYTHIPAAGDKAVLGQAPIPGVRYVYNVADTNLPTYSEAKMMIGFDNQKTPTTAKVVGAKSALCAGYDSAAITASGFVPLNSGSTRPANNGGGFVTATTVNHVVSGAPAFGGTSDVAGAFCREFPGPHFPDYGGRLHWTPQPTNNTAVTPKYTGWVAST